MSDNPDLACARVSVAGGQRHGTAFCIGPRHLLTALHVVADTRSTPPQLLGSISLRFEGRSEDLPATVLSELTSTDGDWAVLECAVPPGVPALALRSEVAADQAWRSFGYPLIESAGLTVAGVVRNVHADIRPPASRRLQLFCDEAATGAALHGLSGAPCLVDGQVVGILRRTLVEDVVDGAGRTTLRTQAGTVFATPATEVVEHQRARGLALLPPPWCPPPDAHAQLRGADFLVVLSSHEPARDTDARSGRTALRAVAVKAHGSLAKTGLGAPLALPAEDILASTESLQACVEALCRARVVVFDATGWEPAVMFLAGIRAVCRRGVTLLSVGGEVQVGSDLGVPHNLKDANIVVHSSLQNSSPLGSSVALMVGRLRRGMAEQMRPHYLDLPVYDAIRQLPPERRGIIPSEEGVLVLCSFKPQQQEYWKSNLQPALTEELRLLREQQGQPAQALVGVARSFELNSPRLVTQAIYEYIRRMQSCVVDLSGWSANVLFELGVRLAASRERTVCLINAGWAAEAAASGSVAAQCQLLYGLLLDARFEYRPDNSYEGEGAFARAYGPNAAAAVAQPPLLRDATVHLTAVKAVDVAGEPASRSVLDELMDQADLFSRDAGQAGHGKPAGLFPDNQRLKQCEAEADFERHLAAWLLLRHHHGADTIRAQPALRARFVRVYTALLQRHAERLDHTLKAELAAMDSAIEQVVRAKVEAVELLATPTEDSPPESAVVVARKLKSLAAAERNQQKFGDSLQHLDQAQQALTRQLQQSQSGAQPDAREIAALQAEIADTLGMKGGVFRRMGPAHVGDAMQAYEAGLTIERQLRSGTYNLGNVIELRITALGISPQDTQLRAEIAQAIELLGAAVQGARRDEWWAWSDLGRFHLLAGQPDAARQAYAQGRTLAGPSSEEITRHVSSLRALAEPTSATAPEVAADLQAAAQELRAWLGPGGAPAP